MSTELELVYFSGCPNVDETRANLRSAFTQLARDPEWREWNLDDAATPDRVRGFASPTILIDGAHLFGEKQMPAGATACSAAGAPSAAAIMEAIGENP